MKCLKNFLKNSILNLILKVQLKITKKEILIILIRVLEKYDEIMNIILPTLREKTKNLLSFSTYLSVKQVLFLKYR